MQLPFDRACMRYICQYHLWRLSRVLDRKLRYAYRDKQVFPEYATNDEIIFWKSSMTEKERIVRNNLVVKPWIYVYIYRYICMYIYERTNQEFYLKSCLRLDVQSRISDVFTSIIAYWRESIVYINEIVLII